MEYVEEKRPASLTAAGQGAGSHASCPHLDHVRMSSAQEVRRVLNDRSLSADPRRSNVGSYFRKVVEVHEHFEPTLLHMDDPDHQRLRSHVVKSFSWEQVDSKRERIQRLTNGLLDALQEERRIDVMAALAVPLPALVIADLLGVPDLDQQTFAQWAAAQRHYLNPEKTETEREELGRTKRLLINYLSGLIEDRRRAPGDDLISNLIATQGHDEQLTQADILRLCQLLLIAGSVTTADAIGNGLLLLLEHPDQFAALREDRALLPNAIEEILRFDPPVSEMQRVALGPTVVGEMRVDAGQTICASIRSANHDPLLNRSPDVFDVRRIDLKHVSFGGGTHFCLGATLARLEIEIALNAMLDRFPELQLDATVSPQRRQQPVFNGIEALWVNLRGA